MPPKKSQKAQKNTTPKKTKLMQTIKKKSKRSCGRKGYIALYDAHGNIRCVSKNSTEALQHMKIMEHKDKCQKQQRPKKLGRTLPCPMNSIIKKNPKGYHCCYVFKKPKTQTKATTKKKTTSMSTKKKATTTKNKTTTTTKKAKAKTNTSTQRRKTLYQRISQKYTVAKKDKKELPELKNLCAKLFGNKRFMLANVKKYVHLLNIHNDARKTKTVSDELKKFDEIKKLKTDNQIIRLIEIFEYIVTNSKRAPSKKKEIFVNSNDSETGTSSETENSDNSENFENDSETESASETENSDNSKSFQNDSETSESKKEEKTPVFQPYFDKYGRYHAKIV